MITEHEKLIELERCPFCGQKLYFEYMSATWNHPNWECPAADMSPFRSDDVAAVARWNRRPTTKTLLSQLDATRAERDGARRALEHDRTRVIDAVNAITDEMARSSWLLTSRGSYTWDDDRYRAEFGAAMERLQKPVETMRQIGVDWSNCPTTDAEVQAARAPLAALKHQGAET